MTIFFRSIVVLVSVLAASTAWAAAADLSGDQRSLVAALTKHYFHAVVFGESNDVVAITTRDFVFTGVDGKKLTAQDLAARWQITNLTTSDVREKSGLDSASIDGTTITADVSESVSSQSSIQEPPLVTSINSQHRVTLVNSGGTWKISADTELRRSVTQ